MDDHPGLIILGIIGLIVALVLTLFAIDSHNNRVMAEKGLRWQPDQRGQWVPIDPAGK